jgi:hypothetical protein
MKTNKFNINTVVKVKETKKVFTITSMTLNVEKNVMIYSGEGVGLYFEDQLEEV